MKVWEVKPRWFFYCMVNESGVSKDTLSATAQLSTITPCSTTERRSDCPRFWRILRK